MGTAHLARKRVPRLSALIWEPGEAFYSMDPCMSMMASWGVSEKGAEHVEIGMRSPEDLSTRQKGRGGTGTEETPGGS